MAKVITATLPSSAPISVSFDDLDRLLAPGFDIEVPVALWLASSL
jgi:hypothetical protein